MLQRYSWKDGAFPENDLKAIQKSKFLKDTQIKRLTQVKSNNRGENRLKEGENEYT